MGFIGDSMFFDYVHLFLSNTEQNLTRKFTNTFYFYNLNHGYIIFVYIFNAEITLRYVPTSLCAHFVMCPLRYVPTSLCTIGRSFIIILIPCQLTRR
jgi:hypothetical protein